MPTLTIEIKKGSRKPYPVSFLVCSGNTKKRIPTGIKVSDSELSANGRKIKCLNKARLIEGKRRELQDRLDALLIDTIGQSPVCRIHRAAHHFHALRARLLHVL